MFVIYISGEAFFANRTAATYTNHGATFNEQNYAHSRTNRKQFIRSTCFCLKCNVILVYTAFTSFCCRPCFTQQSKRHHVAQTKINYYLLRAAWRSLHFFCSLHFLHRAGAYLHINCETTTISKNRGEKRYRYRVGYFFIFVCVCRSRILRCTNYCLLLVLFFVTVCAISLKRSMAFANVSSSIVRCCHTFVLILNLNELGIFVVIKFLKFILLLFPVFMYLQKFCISFFRNNLHRIHYYYLIFAIPRIGSEAVVLFFFFSIWRCLRKCNKQA